MSAPVRIIIAEPSVIIRKGMIEILRRFDDLRFEVFEVVEAGHLRDRLSWHKPDILMANPSVMGYDSLRQVKKENRGLKCVALVSSLADQSLLREYDREVSLYDTADQIRDKLTSLVSKPLAEKNEDTLSPREKEVVACVVMGMTNKQIADRLCLSTHTVITHRRNIASKLQIHSAAGLTIYAIVNKLVDLDAIRATQPEGE